MLLLFAAFQSHIAAGMGSDINRSGSLRYRSLWLYGATGGNASAEATRTWQQEFAAMDAIRADIAERYPADYQGFDEPWQSFSHQLITRNRVDWDTTEQVRLAANQMTNSLDQELHRRNRIVSLLLGGAGLCLAFTVPWGVYITFRLRRVETERSGHAIEIAHASSRFKDLFQGIPAACFSYDDEGRIMDWNRAAETLFGKRAEDVHGKHLWEAISRPERQEASRTLVRQVLSGLSLPDLEWIYAMPDGSSERHILTNVFPLRDTTGRVIGAISVNLDITERHRNEDRIRHLLEEAAESAERLRSVAARAQCMLWEADVTEVPARTGADPLMLFDREQNTRLAWEMRIFGEEDVLRWLPLERRDGERFDSAWVRSRTLDEQRAVVQRTREALHTRATHYEHEFPCRLADGSLRWLGEGVRIETRGPGRWQLVGICTDITERRAAEERMRALTTELERSNAALQEFAQIASHDLKEPLRKIQTFGDMLQRRTADSLGQEAQGYVERIVTSTRRMQALVDGLLEFSRVSRKPREPMVVMLDEIVAEVLFDLETQISESRARVTVDSLPPVMTDALQMRQLFQNLIGNSLKFSQPGMPPQVTVRDITTADDRTGKWVRIAVSDDGIGFDSRYSERIFEVFEQLEAGASEGIGIGLAICRKIVERHGGVIVAEGRPGEGATFTFTLPASTE